MSVWHQDLQGQLLSVLLLEKSLTVVGLLVFITFDLINMPAVSTGCTLAISLA